MAAARRPRATGAVAELVAVHKLVLLEQFERPVHGRITHRRVFQSHRLMQLIDVEMSPLFGEENARDCAPLGGQPLLVIGQLLLK